MTKLIDADKLLEWIRQELNELPVFCEKPEDKAKYSMLDQIIDLTNTGTFDPTPPVQPDTGEVIK